MPSEGGDFTNFIGPSSSFATTGVKGSMLYSSAEDPPGSTIYLSYFYDTSQSSPYAAGDTPNLTPDGMYAAVQIGDPGSRYIETYTLSPYDSALPSVPRVSDDSNPVWIVPDHAHLAFVSAGPGGETIQICRLWNDYTTPIEIAPHDRVWYLSKRFNGESSVAQALDDQPVLALTPTEPNGGSEPAALPTLEPLPVEETSESTSTEPAVGSIEVHVADCPVGYTGPDFSGICHDNGNGEAHWNVIVTGSSDFREILDTAIEASPGPAVAWIEGLAPGIYGVELMTKFVKASAYVFCSPDQGVTVLVDQFLADYHDPVQVPVNGQPVVCDWYQLN